MPRIVAKAVDSQKGDGEAAAARRELVDVAKMPAPQTSSASGSNNNNDATASANDNNNENNDSNNDSDSDMIGDDSPSKNTRAAQKKRKQEDAAPPSSDEDDDHDDDDNVDIDAETAEWKNKKKKSKSKKKSAVDNDKESAKEKKEKMLKWIEQMTMDHIELTSDGNDVETVGGAQWSNLKAYAKIAFIKKNKIRVPNELRNNTNQTCRYAADLTLLCLAGVSCSAGPRGLCLF